MSEPSVEFRDGFRPNDPDVGIWLYFAEAPSEEAFEDLNRLFNAWYLVGHFGGYGGGGFHHMSDVVQMDEGEMPLVRVNVDMGSRYWPQSIDTLRRALVGWGRVKTGIPPHVRNRGVRVERIEVGAPERLGPG